MEGQPKTFGRVVIGLWQGAPVCMTDEEHVECVNLHVGVGVCVRNGKEVFHVIGIDYEPRFLCQQNRLVGQVCPWLVLSRDGRPTARFFRLG